MFESIAVFFERHPREIMALLAGLCVSWGLTQRLKFLVPETWSYHAREVNTQLMAFMLGFASTALVWALAADGSRRWTDAMVAGLVIGLIAPALWSVLMLIIGWKFPALKDAFSQDVRKGVVLSEPARKDRGDPNAAP